MHTKSLRELPAMTYETSKCQQTDNSPDLLIFNKFHAHILKNRTMLFPTLFISASEKIGVGLKKQSANFLFQFHPEKGSPIFLF